MCDEQDPEERLDELTSGADPEQIDEYLDSLSAGETANAVAGLTDEAKQRLMTTLSAHDAAELLERLPEVQAVELVDMLEPSDAAAIVSELPSDEQADILSELPESEAESILDALPADEADEVRALTRYEDDQAGGLMVTEVLSFPADATIGEMIADLGVHAEEYRRYDIQYTYVIDRHGRLIGVLPMREVLLAPRRAPIRDVMIADPLAVPDVATLTDLRDFFDRHHFFGVPVVNAAGHLLGVVNRAAVEERHGEQVESDLLRSQGLLSEELRSMPVLRRSSRRLAWLSVNILLNIVAASVIAAYQDTLQAVIALAVFLPIISDMSGCSGNQAVAVSMRELTLGVIGPANALRVWWKELSVGLINGVALGLLVGAAAWLWQGNAWLGLVVGGALAINTLVAVSVGGCVPLLLKRFSLDPALASGPILTTVTDMCGFLLALAFATALLPRLAG